MRVERAGGQGLPVGLVGHVGADEFGVAAGVADGVLHGEAVAFNDIGDQHGCALAGEEACFGGAHAGCAAGDDRDFAGESVGHRAHSG